MNGIRQVTIRLVKVSWTFSLPLILTLLTRSTEAALTEGSVAGLTVGLRLGFDVMGLEDGLTDNETLFSSLGVALEMPEG